MTGLSVVDAVFGPALGFVEVGADVLIEAETDGLVLVDAVFVTSLLVVGVSVTL